MRHFPILLRASRSRKSRGLLIDDPLREFVGGFVARNNGRDLSRELPLRIVSAKAVDRNWVKVEAQTRGRLICEEQMLGSQRATECVRFNGYLAEPEVRARACVRDVNKLSYVRGMYRAYHARTR